MDYTTLGHDIPTWDNQNMGEDFTQPKDYGEQVDTQPLHDAKEELRHQLIETIERYTIDAHKHVVMDAVKQLMDLK